MPVELSDHLFPAGDLESVSPKDQFEASDQCPFSGALRTDRNQRHFRLAVGVPIPSQASCCHFVEERWIVITVPALASGA